MKTFSQSSHHGVEPVCRWIGLSLVLCFFIGGFANAMTCDDALLRFKNCGISKAQLSRTGNANKIKVDYPIVAATENHTFDKIYLPSVWKGYGSQRPFIASLLVNPLSNKAPPTLF